jgi:apolipoprotein N-acyltransferase
MKKSVRYSLLALAALVTAFFGYRLFSLWQQETLWGHLPLYFFVSAWVTLVFIFWKKYTRRPKGLRWLGLSTLSGVLLALGFPPLPLTFLMFIGWVPLLLVEHEISKEAKGAVGKWAVWGYAYHTFVLWNILTTWWVGNTAFVAGIVAIWLNAFFMSVPFALFSWTKKVTPRLSYLAFIAYWIAFEWLHLHWEISWVWLNLGNAFARFPTWIQWYEYTGTFGGTLWILLANFLIFKLFNKFLTAGSTMLKTAKWDMLQIVGLVVLPVALSFWMYSKVQDEGKEVEVVVVQPNFEPHYRKFQVPVYDQMEIFLRLSASNVTDKTAYLVWPETAFSAGNLKVVDEHPVVLELKKFLQKYPNLKLVTGVGAYKLFDPGEKTTRHTRIEIKGQDTLRWESYNAALQIDAKGDSVPYYIKSKLVPGAEILPYHELFFFLEPLVEKLDGTVEGLGNQPDREAFYSSSGRVAPVICYESVFGEYHAGYVRAGAEATFIMTNDGWWDNTAGHKQHLLFASLRAVETRRSIARSANTGISCFLNQRGDILQPTKYGVEAAIKGKIRLNDAITFYVKWGDLIARIGLFATAILILNAFVKGILQKTM